MTDEVELVFLLDEDDETRFDYPPVRTIVGPAYGDPCQPLNAAVRETTTDVGFTGDDSRFETHGWDRKVLDILARGPSYVWADDGHDKPWPSTCFASRGIPQTLGWFVLPELRRGFFDVVWVMLAEGTGTKHTLPEVMIRHDNSMHPVAPEVIAQDERTFNDWAMTKAPRDIRTLRHALYS